MMIKTILNTFIIIFVLTVYSYSDTVVKMEYKDNFSKTINKNTNSFKGSDMRMDFYEGGEHLTSTMIFKGSQNRMINLDHRSKTYYLMDKETLQSLASQMNAVMAELEIKMAKMSPEERAMMEKMMKGNLPSEKSSYVEPVLKQTGTDNINGYSCTKYEVYNGSAKVRELCVTKWSNIEGGTEIKNSISSMTSFMEDITKSLSQGSAFMANTANFEKNVFNEINKLNGFPVQTVDYRNGQITGISTFKSSEIINLDASTFIPPAGYKKQEMVVR